MWDVLSGDFDTKISGEACLNNVLKHTQAGSIVVFHDSAKAWDRLQVALPATLEHFTQLGYHFRALQKKNWPRQKPRPYNPYPIKNKNLDRI